MTAWIVVRTAGDQKIQPSSSQAKKLLRKDFCWSCAYCTITELEAQGVSFEIDHYLPQVSHTDLRNVYKNLMYSCRTCNRLKSDYAPDANQLTAGHRFFKADEDDPRDHFRVQGVQLKAKSPVGTFTIIMLDLNQKALLRLRGIRKDLFESDEAILAGARALSGLTLDQLPAAGRHEIASRIPKVLAAVDASGRALDDAIAKAMAKSSLLDDLEERRKTGRAEFLESINALTPLSAGKRKRTSRSP